jgi:hypothetical protein
MWRSTAKFATRFTLHGDSRHAPIFEAKPLLYEQKFQLGGLDTDLTMTVLVILSWNMGQKRVLGSASGRMDIYTFLLLYTPPTFYSPPNMSPYGPQT